ncbi:MAG: glycerol-3-phosphate 1-O-acyltransferase PlsY [Candidatus Binatia bacterium]
MLEVALILLAYLLGSVPTGYILGSLVGVDVRKAGSGNVGATNVARVVGKGRGALTLIVDVAKGWLAVFVALQFGVSLLCIALVGSAVFLGHLYPIFLRFRGGKGVATAFGVFLAVAPGATLFLIGVFALVVAPSRIVSLASIAAAITAPVIFWLFDLPPMLIAMAGFIALMITWRHHENIRRLRAGTEPKFGSANSR